MQKDLDLNLQVLLTQPGGLVQTRSSHSLLQLPVLNSQERVQEKTPQPVKLHSPVTAVQLNSREWPTPSPRSTWKRDWLIQKQPSHQNEHDCLNSLDPRGERWCRDYSIPKVLHLWLLSYRDSCNQIFERQHWRNWTPNQRSLFSTDWRLLLQRETESQKQ